MEVDRGRNGSCWRWLGAVAVAMAGLTAPVGPHPLQAQEEAPPSVEELVREAKSAVVLLETQTPDGWTGQGSGFLVEASGLLVTNHHVIQGANRLRVRLESGDSFEEVEVMDVDEKRDLAVLRVRGFGLPTVPLGNSDSISVGARAVAIGSPLGLENTVTTGVVSGRRTMDGYQLIQVSTPISPGSSGGPVFGPEGAVIGVAVAQIREGQNLNFAVPINYARGMLAHLPDDPEFVFTPEGRNTAPSAEPTSTASESRVNQFLKTDFGDINVGAIKYVIEEKLENDNKRTTSISYRLSENQNDPDATLARFADIRTEHKQGLLGPTTEVARAKAKIVVSASSFRPIEAEFQGEFYNGSRWVRQRVKLDFSPDGRVTGSINRGDGDRIEVDRVLPAGTIPRSMVGTAVMFLKADSVMGRTFTFNVYDMFHDELEEVEYRFLKGKSVVEVDGNKYEAYRVNSEWGLDQEYVFYKADRPRIFLGFWGEDEDKGEVKELHF